MYLQIIKVICVETDLCLECVPIFLIQLCEDFYQVKACSLSQPVQLLEFVQLMVKFVSFIESFLPKVVLPLAYRLYLSIELCNLIHDTQALLFDHGFSWCLLDCSNLTFKIEQLRIDTLTSVLSCCDDHLWTIFIFIRLVIRLQELTSIFHALDDLR